MATDLRPVPISSLPSADLESTDQIVAYRDTDGKAYRSVVGQIGSTNLSDAFDTSKSYSAGDYCIYSDTLYKFTSDHSGRWTGDDVEATLVGNELTELNTNLACQIIAGTTVSETVSANSSQQSAAVNPSAPSGYSRAAYWLQIEGAPSVLPCSINSGWVRNVTSSSQSYSATIIALFIKN